MRHTVLGCVSIHRLGLWLVLGLLLSSAGFPQSVNVRHQGRDYIDLATAGARLGMDTFRLRGTDITRLRSKWTRIEVGKGKKVLHLNRMPIYLGFPTLLRDGRLYLARADYQHAVQSILTPQLFPSPPDLKRIVLDPGHGGRDSGAVNRRHGLTEKALNFDIAQRLKVMLEREGYDVRLTRDSDQFVPLAQRPRISNRVNADLFVSIHFNAAENKNAAGLETFALTPQFQASSKFREPTARDGTRYDGNDYDPWNALVGYHVQRSLVRAIGGPDRGLKRARFLVLKQLECPGVLVELGFISHEPTAQRLRSSSHRQQIAESLFDGIIAYHQRLRRIP